MKLSQVAAVLMAGAIGVGASTHSADAATLGPWCKALKKQPAYHYNYQGATIFIPAGKKLVGKHPQERRCKVLVREYRSHKH